MRVSPIREGGCSVRLSCVKNSMWAMKVLPMGEGGCSVRSSFVRKGMWKGHESLAYAWMIRGSD